jgi:hypothetical protein
MGWLLNMSIKKLSRLEVMQRLLQKHISLQEAGEILQLGARQVKRLLKAYRKIRGFPNNLILKF